MNSTNDFPTKNEPVIITIHGTFASGNEQMPAWWEQGSAFQEKLFARLEADSGSPTTSVAFRWSGKNSENERRKAGVELLAYLRDLEAKKIPYHIITHSHGGIVLWNALMFSLKPALAKDNPFLKIKGSPLRLLLSWTTVGTPFIRGTKSKGVNNPILDYYVPFILFGFAGQYVIVKLFQTILKRKVEMRDVPWIMVALLQLRPLRTLFGRTKINKHMLHTENEANELAVKEYAKQWLGIWSVEDEAFAGLKGTFSPPMSLLPRYRKGFKSVPFSSIVHWNLVDTYDRFVAPWMDRKLWSLLCSLFQGNDRLGHSYESVNPEPSQILEGVPPIADGFTQRMVERAEKNIGLRIPQLRANIMKTLEASSTGLAFTEIASVLDSDELVHCLSFEDEVLARIVAAHVRSESGIDVATPMDNIEAIPNDEEISSYIKGFKDYIKKCLSRTTDVVNDGKKD